MSAPKQNTKYKTLVREVVVINSSVGAHIIQQAVSEAIKADNICEAQSTALYLSYSHEHLLWLLVFLKRHRQGRQISNS